MKAKLQGVHPVLAAKDVRASAEFYRLLGFELRFQDEPTAPKYAAVTRDGVELHLQWADPSQWAHSADRPVFRFRVDDVDALYAEFVSSGGVNPGAKQSSPWAAPADTPWRTREFHLRDPGLNILQFYRPVSG